MRVAALLLALTLPHPVTTIDAFANFDHSATIVWTLPGDPSIVGVTVFRERLDVLEPEIQFSLGLHTEFTDYSTASAGSYRYWVHTRNASGDLSVGAFVEVFTGSGTVFVDTSSSGTWFVCWASASPEAPLWPLGLAALILALGLILQGWRRSSSPPRRSGPGPHTSGRSRD